MAAKLPSSTLVTVRFRAFRERLAEGNYRRVEGYVTADEKAQIDALRKELGITMDAAVAGLLRLGLHTYQQASASASDLALRAGIGLPGSPAVTAMTSCAAGTPVGLSMGPVPWAPGMPAPRPWWPFSATRSPWAPQVSGAGDAHSTPPAEQKE